MNDARDAVSRWLAHGDKVALATVVATRKSAPRPHPATPAETALSILAEILAVRAGREGGRLRASTGTIHAEPVR